MKERPILFSGPMVRALLEGRKTQTRRMVKQLLNFPAITEFGKSDTPGYDWIFRNKRMLWNDLRHDELLKCCPKGQVGDRLWVRENFRIVGGEPGHDNGVDQGGNHDFSEGFAAVEFQAGGQQVFYELTDEDDQQVERLSRGMNWQPSIHMPRWASRIQLEITEVRVQRLDEITHNDAADEGISCVTHKSGLRNNLNLVTHVELPANGYVGVFKKLWDSINGKRPGATWLDNPWVWAITFKRV